MAWLAVLVRRTSLSLAFAFVISIGLTPAPAQAGERPLTLQETRQLVERVAQSPDPSAAFAVLSPTRRSAFVAYVTPVLFEVGGDVRAASVVGGQGGKVASRLADTCNTEHNWIRGQNILGITMWQFDHEVTWCYNGSTITNNPATRSWASNICGACGWSYVGLLNEARYPSDGYGQTSFTYQSQGHFHLANPSMDSYPTLRTEVRGDGSTYLQGWQ